MCLDHLSSLRDEQLPIVVQNLKRMRKDKYNAIQTNSTKREERAERQLFFNNKNIKKKKKKKTGTSIQNSTYSVEGFQHICWSKIQLVQDYPVTSTHGCDQHTCQTRRKPAIHIHIISLSTHCTKPLTESKRGFAASPILTVSIHF